MCLAAADTVTAIIVSLVHQFVCLLYIIFTKRHTFSIKDRNIKHLHRQEYMIDVCVRSSGDDSNENIVSISLLYSNSLTPFLEAVTAYEAR